MWSYGGKSDDKCHMTSIELSLHTFLVILNNLLNGTDDRVDCSNLKMHFTIRGTSYHCISEYHRHRRLKQQFISEYHTLSIVFNVCTYGIIWYE